MSINRNTILRGPGTVKFGGATVFDANGITCEIESATQGLPSSISGEIGTIKTDQTGEDLVHPLRADLRRDPRGALPLRVGRDRIERVRRG